MSVSHPLNQAVIAQVLFDLRIGQFRRCLRMGFSEKDLNLLRNPEMVSVLLNTRVPWCEIKVDSDVLHRLLHQVHDAQKEITLIDRMLRLDASSKMICEVFGLNQREVAFRRKLLELTKKRGRWIELNEAQEHELWRLWQAKIKEHSLDIDDMMDMARVCMYLSQEKDIPMATIWQAIEKWIREGLA